LLSWHAHVDPCCSYQEDAYVACSIDIPAKDIRLNLRDSQHRDASTWRTASRANTDKEQVAFFACFDGHGGDGVSKLLRDKLPSIVEDAAPSSVAELFETYRGIGGYMRRWSNNLLARHRESDETDMALDERAAFAWVRVRGVDAIRWETMLSERVGGSVRHS
jgi:hypothetical protein